MNPKQLREARLRLGLTWKALAEKLGIHWRTVAKYEAGDSVVPRTTELAVKALEMMEKEK